MSRKTVVILVCLATCLGTLIIAGYWLSTRMAAEQPARPNLLSPMALGRGATLGINIQQYLMEHPDVAIDTFELTMLTEGPNPRVRPADLLDPWGRPFDIVRYADGTLDIRSLGADGREGGVGEDRDVLVPGF